MVKNLPANAGNVRDTGCIPGLGRSPGGGNGNPCQYSCLEIPWTKKFGRLQSMGSQRVGPIVSESIATLFDKNDAAGKNANHLSMQQEWTVTNIPKFPGSAECLSMSRGRQSPQ